MSDYWNNRYAAKEYAYGEEPNVFFAEEIQKIKPGKIILPCDGEGRNAVYAATLGWEVKAFDSSEEGKAKAVQLASKKNVRIDYLIDDASLIEYPEKSADVVALIYAHLPVEVRTRLYKEAISWLNPGGRIILEAFNTNQLGNSSGGPKDVTMLFNEQIIQELFGTLQTELLQMMHIELQEGEYHKGPAEVLRFIGIKL
jgi:SAM-dependent methyltransferase